MMDHFDTADEAVTVSGRRPFSDRRSVEFSKRSGRRSMSGSSPVSNVRWQRPSRGRLTSLICLVVVLIAPDGFAQDATRMERDDLVGNRPWAQGVSDQQQTQALDKFKQGNALFEDHQYANALTTYREAIAFWDHPAIRFNIAVSLIHLDDPVQAFENLESALRYGESPL